MQKRETLHKKVLLKIEHLKDNHIVRNGKAYDLSGTYIGDQFDAKLENKYTDKQIESFQSLKVLGDHEKENGGFVFLFYHLLLDMMQQLPNLTKPDIARLLYMFTYIQFETNKITYDNGREINDNDLSDMLKLKPKQYKAFIKKLVDNGYMYIDEDGYKVIDNRLCKYGSINTYKMKKENIQYTRLFKKTVRDIFHNATSRELGRVSIIYLVLPYVNLTTNIISHNPSETISDKIKPMTLIELSLALGYKDCTAFRKQLYNVKIDNQNVFGFFLLEEDRRTMKIVVNPRIVCACDGEQLAAIKALFNGYNK